MSSASLEMKGLHPASPAPPPVRPGVSAVDFLCWRLTIWAMGGTVVMLTAVRPRRFIVGDIDVVEKATPLADSLSMCLSLLFLMLLFLAVATLILKGKIPRERQSVRALWLTFTVLAVLPALSSLVVGGGGKGLHMTAMTIAIYSTSYLLAAPPVDWWVREVRRMLLVLFIYGSLFAAVAFPDWAWSTGYDLESVTSLFPLRLFGTGNHANTLAPTAAFFLVLGGFPGTKLRGERLHLVAALLVLFFAQSKTIWGISAALLAICWYRRVKRMPKNKQGLALSVAGFFVLVGVGYLLTYSTVIKDLENIITNPQVLTLTGRLPIWALAVEMWFQSPWLGHGLDAWSSKESMLDKLSSLGFTATHAHNQILQVVSQAGICGLAAFVAFTWSYFALIRRLPSGFLEPMLYLTGMYMLQGMTEVVMQYNLGSGSTLLTWLLVSLMLILGKRTASVTAYSRCM
jgi:O-antigen ligase